MLIGFQIGLAVWTHGHSLSYWKHTTVIVKEYSFKAKTHKDSSYCAYIPDGRGDELVMDSQNLNDHPQEPWCARDLGKTSEPIGLSHPPAVDVVPLVMSANTGF